MPRYDYKCGKCGGVQEVYQEFGHNYTPTCCQESMTKIYSATPAHFKGGGWGGQ